MIPRRIKRSFHHQFFKNDCGIACLKSLAAYYGLVLAPNWYGVLGERGISLLELKKEAIAMGLTVEAKRIDKEDLPALQQVAVLVIRSERGHYHTVIFYPQQLFFNKRKVLIGDPAKGLAYISTGDLPYTGQALLVHYPQQSKQQEQSKWDSKELHSGGIILCWSVIGSLLGLVMPIYLQRVIDQIHQKNLQLNELTGALLFLIFCLLLRNFIQYLRYQLTLQFSYEYQWKNFKAWFNHLKQQPGYLFQQLHSNDLKRMWKEHHSLQQLDISFYTQFGNDLMIYLLWMGLCCYYTPFLFLFMLTGHLVLFLFLWLQFPQIFREQEHLEQKQYTLERGYFNWCRYKHSLGSIPGAGRMDDELSQKHQLFYTEQKGYGSFFGQLQCRLDMLLGIINYGAIFLLIRGFAIGYYTEGVMMASLSVIYFQMPVVQRLTNGLKGMYLQAGYRKRRKSFTARSGYSKVTEFYTAFDHLYLWNLGVRLKQGKGWLFRNITLEIEKGDFVNIEGCNGSGKSTLLKCLSGLMVTDEGKIIFDHREENALQSYAAVMGYLPQEPLLTEGTLHSNITLCDDADLPDFKAFCDYFKLHDYFSQYPKGLQTAIVPEVMSLSGGQIKMIALLRLLYHKPQVLLLDEPDVHLDKEQRLWLLHLFQLLKGHVTMVVVSHDAELVKMCNKKIKLN